MGVFDDRVAFKPFEYPEITGFKKAIHNSFWTFEEWDFIGDKHDYLTVINDVERNALKNSILAISQIEVAVKRFWGQLGERFPKAEFEQVGAVFADSEVRHSDAYSHILEVLGLNDEFDALLENPVIIGRVDYLKKSIKGAREGSDKQYTFSLALFSLFVENVSLFSQFAVVKSFNKHKTILKDIDNVIQATQQEELIHAKFGTYLINLIKEENPEWFDEAFYKELSAYCLKAYEAESAIIDWIFERGDLEFVSAAMIKEFTKDRFNTSLQGLGAEPMFEVDYDELSKLKWFVEELLAITRCDFFYKKSTNYSKGTQAINADSLF